MDQSHGSKDPTANDHRGDSNDFGLSSTNDNLSQEIAAKAVATPYTMQITPFQNDHNFTIIGNATIQNQKVTNVYGGERDGLKHLNGFISFDAQFDSSAQDPDRQCHPETRQNVLVRLRDWIDDPNSTERILWLYGPAGVGKSAIAQTIARSYPQSKVTATFFFFRSDVNRNDGNRLFTTLAYQLALSMPEIKNHIVQALNERPDLPRTDIETQFHHLIARPFQLLNEGATQQLAPAAHTLGDIVKKYQELAPIIIIDGVDECTDVNLQRRFLKIIGDAVKDKYFPLRFLVVSRPEFHIEHTIRRFQSPTLSIDLAQLDDVYRDIEKYLMHEFSRIASEQGLDSTWPGREVIDDIVYKSSGNFIFAVVVIKFVGDQYCFAKAQLEIILNMKPIQTTTPFAKLDQLYLEILMRVPDQDFLKRYLALLIARSSVSSDYGELYKDDAMLMHCFEEELHANLRRMRSLLKFERFIHIYHKSFLDFLHNSSRSGQYYIRNQDGMRGYLEVFIDSLARFVSVIEQPDRHGGAHFAPQFSKLIQSILQTIKLDIEDWENMLRPLLDSLDQLLVPPKVNSLMTGYCQECRFFQITYDILTHFKSLREKEDPVVEKCLTSLREILNIERDFDMNFGRHIFGSAAIVGLVMAILAHRR